MSRAFQRGYQKVAIAVSLLIVIPLTLRPWDVKAVSGPSPTDSAFFDQDPNLLRDKIDPCFNNSPVGPAFTQEMPIPPTASPVPNPDAAEDTYVLREQRGEAQIVPRF